MVRGGFPKPLMAKIKKWNQNATKMNRKIPGFPLRALSLLHRWQAGVLVRGRISNIGCFNTFPALILIHYNQQNCSCLALKVGVHLRPQDAQPDHTALPPDQLGQQRGGGAQVHCPWQARPLQLHRLRQEWFLSRYCGIYLFGFYWLNLQVLTWWTTLGWMCKRQERHQPLTHNGSLR